MADPDESTADHLDELVLRWQELRQQGREVRPEDLTNCPELARELRLRAEKILAVEAMLDGSDADSANDWPRYLPNIPNYEVSDVLGKGGMGIVYKARHVELNRPCALKMILAGKYAGPEALARFKNEARAAAQFSHENVVRIYTVGDYEGQPFLEMELIEGGTLADQLAGGPRSPHAAAQLIASLASVLDEAHQRGIVHRDLKPSNILLTGDGTPKIADFGLAKALNFDLARALGLDGSLTLTGNLVGTIRYMSPEQAAGGAGEVGPPCDIYSLGVIFYELLTGHLVVEESDPLLALIHIREREPIPPRQHDPEIPLPLELICLKCLKKKPEDRYSSAAQMAKELERFLKGEPIKTPPPGVWQRWRHWAGREPALAIRLLACMGGFILIVTSLWLRQDPDPFPFSRVTHVAVLLLWGLVSVVLQQLLNRGRSLDRVQLTWSVIDVVFISAMLMGAKKPLESPLVLAYPAVIVAAGLWLDINCVILSTYLSNISYLILLSIEFIEERRIPANLDRHAASMILLAITGVITAQQVRRIRDLSGYYESHSAHRE